MYQTRSSDWKSREDLFELSKSVQALKMITKYQKETETLGARTKNGQTLINNIILECANHQALWSAQQLTRSFNQIIDKINSYNNQ